MRGRSGFLLILVWSLVLGVGTGWGRSVVFPSTTPVHGWGLKDALDGLTFDHPVAITYPAGFTNSLFVVERMGRIYAVTNLNQPTKTLFLQVSIPALFQTVPEAGLLGMAFHPRFPLDARVFIYRSTYLNPPNQAGYYNRLSSYRIKEGNPFEVDPSTETVILEQRDNNIEQHNAGTIQFGPDGYLYLALGDASPPIEDHALTKQPIDKNFFGGIIRIDIDKRSGNLVPNPHPGVTDQYLVPADNPFVGLTNYQGVPVNPSQVRTEFFAVGLRNPWKFSIHPTSGRILAGDVGENTWEEINEIVKGGNYGWPYMEGKYPLLPLQEPKPVNFQSIPPIWDYLHNRTKYGGSAVTGGVFYLGDSIPGLSGAWIFGDYLSGNIWTLKKKDDGTNEVQWIAGEPKVSCFGNDPRDGGVLLANLVTGTIKKIIYGEDTSFPKLLSQTGLFSDLQTLQPSERLIPYEVNLPFWSDHAEKRRWFQLLGDGSKIGFESTNLWQFPEGTVWVKHFDMDMEPGVSGNKRRLETRVLVKTKDLGYGVTYKWNEAGTDAELVGPAGTNELLVVKEPNGNIRNQTWNYPARFECLVCHTKPAGFALSFTTGQLNRTNGTNQNQLDYLALRNFITNYPGHNPDNLQFATPLDETRSLEYRVRSYLAANCANCHRPGTVLDSANWDARFETPISTRAFHVLIKTNSPGESWLYQRMIYKDLGLMPPLATDVINPSGTNLIANWINSNPLPPWNHGSIGNPYTLGNAAILDGTFGIGAYRGSKQGERAGHYLLREAKGSILLKGVLNVFRNNGQQSRAGLWLKGTDTDPKKSLFVTAHDGIAEISQDPLAEKVLHQSFLAQNEPARICVSRQSNGISAAAWINGKWENIYSTNYLTTDGGHVGFAVTSAEGTTEDYAQFKDVQFVSLLLTALDNKSSIRYPEPISFRPIIVKENYAVRRIEYYSGHDLFYSTNDTTLDVVWRPNRPGTYKIRARIYGEDGSTLDSNDVTIEVLPQVSGTWYSGVNSKIRGSWEGSLGTTAIFTPSFVSPSSLIDFRITPSNPQHFQAPSIAHLLRYPQSNDRSDTYWEGNRLFANIDFKDDALHRVSFYFIKDGPGTSGLNFIVSDTLTHEVKLKHTVPELESGSFITFEVKGNVTFEIINPAPYKLAGVLVDSSLVPDSTVSIKQIPEQVTLPAAILLEAESGPLGQFKSVEFFANGNLIHSTTDPYFSFAWKPSTNGVYSIIARLNDQYGRTITSSPRSVEFILPSASATYLGLDNTTLGKWKGKYGSEAVVIPLKGTNLVSFVSIEPEGQSDYLLSFPWNHPQVPEPFSETSNGGGAWVAIYVFNVKLGLKDGKDHELAVYLFGNPGMAESVEIIDSVSGTVLDTRTYNDAVGEYLRWKVRGNVVVKFNRIFGVSMINGIFVDPLPNSITFGQWQNQSFTQAELDNPFFANEESDPDKDTVPNIIEYVLGTDPKLQSSIWTLTQTDGKTFFQISQNTKVTDMVVSIEASSDLKSWTDPSAQQLEQLICCQTRSGNQLLQLKLIDPARTSPLFLRLKVKRKED